MALGPERWRLRRVLGTRKVAVYQSAYRYGAQCVYETPYDVAYIYGPWPAFQGRCEVQMTGHFVGSAVFPSFLSAYRALLRELRILEAAARLGCPLEQQQVVFGTSAAVSVPTWRGCEDTGTGTPASGLGEGFGGDTHGGISSR